MTVRLMSLILKVVASDCGGYEVVVRYSAGKTTRDLPCSFKKKHTMKEKGQLEILHSLNRAISRIELLFHPSSLWHRKLMSMARQKSCRNMYSNSVLSFCCCCSLTGGKSFHTHHHHHHHLVPTSAVTMKIMMLLILSPRQIHF